MRRTVLFMLKDCWRSPYRPVVLSWFFGTLLLVGAAIALDLVTWHWASTEVPDVSHPATLQLTSPHGGFISGISVHVTGHIDGEAEVWAENWVRQRLEGDVNWRVYHDWFQPNCELHYRPVEVRGGRLTVRYKFH